MIAAAKIITRLGSIVIDGTAATAGWAVLAYLTCRLVDFRNTQKFTAQRTVVTWISPAHPERITAKPRVCQENANKYAAQ